MDNQVPQASTWLRGGKPRKGIDPNDLREPGRGDREREYQTGPRASSGERAADTGGVQARAAHKGADITEALAGEPRVEQSILGEASMGPRVLHGQHRERERRND